MSTTIKSFLFTLLAGTCALSSIMLSGCGNGAPLVGDHSRPVNQVQEAEDALARFRAALMRGDRVAAKGMLARKHAPLFDYIDIMTPEEMRGMATSLQSMTFSTSTGVRIEFRAQNGGRAPHGGPTSVFFYFGANQGQYTDRGIAL